MSKFDLAALVAQHGKKPSDQVDPQFIVLYSRPGGGKGMVYGTPVAVPSGWTNVEDLEVGDEVIGSDGKPVKVYGLWDRGVLPTYRVTFNDGASVVVDGDHLWTVRERVDRTWYTVDTNELILRMNKSSAPRGYEIPVVSPVQFEGGPLPIPPYMLGGLIADGALTDDGLVAWTKNDPNVAKEMALSAEQAGWGLKDNTYGDGNARRWKIIEQSGEGGSVRIKQELDNLDLRVKSGAKHIPQQYLTAAVEDRWELLYGLFDGDGSYREARKTAHYHSTSRQLAEDVVQLCWSLGISARLGNRVRTDGTWRVSLLSDVSPFKVSDHAGKELYTPNKHSRRRVVSIEPAGDGEVRCIAVEANDQLYVTKDFIVTHNTHLAASISDVPGVKKTLIIDTEGSTKGTLAHFDDSKIDILPVTNFAAFNTIFNSLINDKHDYDAVVIDTLDVAQEWAVEHYMETAPMSRNGEKDGFAAWGNVKKWTTQVGKDLQSAPFKSVVCFHETEDKLSDGSVQKTLLLSGSAKAVWPGLPQVVAWLERKLVEGEDDTESAVTFAHFETADNMVTKNRFNLPSVVQNPDFKSLFAYIKKNSKTAAKPAADVKENK